MSLFYLGDAGMEYKSTFADDDEIEVFTPHNGA